MIDIAELHQVISAGAVAFEIGSEFESADRRAMAVAEAIQQATIGAVQHATTELAKALNGRRFTLEHMQTTPTLCDGFVVVTCIIGYTAGHIVGAPLVSG